MYEAIFIRNYFDNHKEDVTDTIYIIHEIFNRVIFILCLMLVLYPTLVGKGGIVSRFFGHPIFSPLAKLTFGVYIFHCFYYIYIYWIALEGYYFTHKKYLCNFVITVTVSYGISFVTTLIFENPINQLVRNFLETSRSGAIPKTLKKDDDTTGKEQIHGTKEKND